MVMACWSSSFLKICIPELQCSALCVTHFIVDATFIMFKRVDPDYGKGVKNELRLSGLVGWNQKVTGSKSSCPPHQTKHLVHKILT